MDAPSELLPRETKQRPGNVSPQVSPAEGMGGELGLQGQEEGKTGPSPRCPGARLQAEVRRVSPQLPAHCAS